MQDAVFGQRLNLPRFGSTFVKLKNKGDRIRFVIADTPKFETLHWVNDEKSLCTKYNTDDKAATCKNCAKWAELSDAGKKDEAKKYAPDVTFYYPVLNLTDENEPKASIFETKPKVHWQIDAYRREGVDVFACLWIVERTEEEGNYFPLKNIGPIKLTTDQKAILEKAKNIKLKATRESSSVVLDTTDEDRPDETP